MVSFCEPHSGVPLVQVGESLLSSDGRVVATIESGIARFCVSDYAESFGWQWNRWEDTLSDERNKGDAKLQLILRRTYFDQYDLEGKVLLECGMGGGDDTEVLLKMPFAEVHSFDLSRAVDRAARFLQDERLVISQASIYDIPYPDQCFDVVYCHRVLQHTPDPLRALRSICRKVRPGGLLFAHCYNRTFRYMMNYKYKYRWLTRRLPPETTFAAISRFGARLHQVNSVLMGSGSRPARWLAYGFLPFEWLPEYGQLDSNEVLELEKLVTFDALTPRYDRPLSWRRFSSTLHEEGFTIEHCSPGHSSPLYATARKSCD